MLDEPLGCDGPGFGLFGVGLEVADPQIAVAADGFERCASEAVRPLWVVCCRSRRRDGSPEGARSPRSGREQGRFPGRGPDRFDGFVGQDVGFWGEVSQVGVRLGHLSTRIRGWPSCFLYLLALCIRPSLGRSNRRRRSMPPSSAVILCQAVPVGLVDLLPAPSALAGGFPVEDGEQVDPARVILAVHDRVGWSSARCLVFPTTLPFFDN